MVHMMKQIQIFNIKLRWLKNKVKNKRMLMLKMLLVVKVKLFLEGHSSILHQALQYLVVQVQCLNSCQWLSILHQQACPWPSIHHQQACQWPSIHHHPECNIWTSFHLGVLCLEWCLHTWCNNKDIHPTVEHQSFNHWQHHSTRHKYNRPSKNKHRKKSMHCLPIGHPIKEVKKKLNFRVVSQQCHFKQIYHKLF